MNEKQPTFELPPQAQPTGLSGNPPIPVGQPMVIKSLAPGEEEVLEAAGWKDGDPVPDNIAAIAAEAKGEATNVSQLPPPVDLTTPPLQMPEETKMEDLPIEEQEKYMSIMQEALVSAKEESDRIETLQSSQVDGAGEGVNEAIRAALQPTSSAVVVEDDTASETYAGTEVRKDAQNEDNGSVDTCPRCAWRLDVEDVIAPTQQDKSDFLQSILGLQPFYKSYALFGDNLHVTVRSLQPSELDACFRQLFMDTKNEKILTAVDEAETLARYRTCLQVCKLAGGQVNFEFPKDIADWRLSADEKETPLPAIWEDYNGKVNKSEILHRSIMSVVGEFNQLVAKLEVNSRNPDFWKAIDTSH
jgi:hypothetical protein